MERLPILQCYVYASLFYDYHESFYLVYYLLLSRETVIRFYYAATTSNLDSCTHPAGSSDVKLCSDEL